MWCARAACARHPTSATSGQCESHQRSHLLEEAHRSVDFCHLLQHACAAAGGGCCCRAALAGEGGGRESSASARRRRGPAGGHRAGPVEAQVAAVREPGPGGRGTAAGWRGRGQHFVGLQEVPASRLELAGAARAHVCWRAGRKRSGEALTQYEGSAKESVWRARAALEMMLAIPAGLVPARSGVKRDHHRPLTACC